MDEAVTPADILRSAGLQAQILVAGNLEYDGCIETYWSNAAKLQPAAIVRPRSAADVAAAVKALVSANQPFAIRSGGHTQWAGANNIDHGVTIDLSLMAKVEYDVKSGTASLGPGARWGDVYATLQKRGRIVAGGRDGNVGVAGLLLGGGITYFTARKGFACDNVVAYEMVLADGRIVTADKSQHSDLFRALKGGSNNFGVVTKFTMNAFKFDRVWGGMTVYPRDIIPEATNAFVDFVSDIPKDPDSNLALIFSHYSAYKDVVAIAMSTNVAGVEQPKAYERFDAFPVTRKDTKFRSMAEHVDAYPIPSNHYSTWFTISFKNDRRIVAKASELHDKLVDDLKAHIPAGDFTTQCLLQPLSTSYTDRSQATGGNVIGLERLAQTDGILLLAAAMVQTKEQHAYAYGKVKEWIQKTEEFATSVEGNLGWIYLNYADKSQQPLQSYGEENLERIKAAAVKYDPDGIFQTLVPGGFKISDADI